VDQAAYGEIIFSLLSNAYMSSGIGFLFHHAGISIRSVYEIDAQAWDEFLHQALWASPYRSNDAIEVDRMRKVKQRRAEIEELLASRRKLLEDLEAIEGAPAEPDAVPDGGITIRELAVMIWRLKPHRRMADILYRETPE
jgi:hypothetical protein